MKLLRKPNLKRRAKTQLFKLVFGTTPNAVKRKVKKKVVPLYGTELSGTLKPKKKIYNAVYSRISVSWFDKLIKLLKK